MQSTEEYLDQLLASVSEEDGNNGQNANQNTENKHQKSIEELDESELTEEALQKQLALLLGLETETENEDFDDDFMSQYTEQVAEEADDIASVIMDEIMEIPEAEPVIEETPEITAPVVESAPTEATPAPEISSTGVLSADEIAALFASMGSEEPKATTVDEVAEVEDVVEITEEIEEAPAVSPVSDSGILSPDEIAALFATMGADNSEEPADVVEVVDEIEDEDTGALTREELEELGLGDIADVLTTDTYDLMAEDLEEVSHPHDVYHQEVELTEQTTKVEPEEEKQIVEIPEFDYNEEILMDIENVDAMLEATAKLAEEDTAFGTEDKVEDDILSMLAEFEEESVMESMAAQEESARAAEEAVNQALEDETPGVPEELLADKTEGKKKKEKKPKKEKVKKEKAEKPVKEKKEKVSLKEKLFSFMFEDENLEDGEVASALAEGLDTEGILEEKPAKAKKEKASKKDKKAKKSKGGKAQDENAAIEAELAEEDKKKAKKKEKPPKEKKAKKVVISEKTSDEEEKKSTKRTIGTKGIVATLLVCASILGLILVGTYFLPKQLSLMAARVAFYAQDYEEAAMRLKGQNLSDSDQIMYEKANLLFGLEERYHQYEIYVQRNMSKEALNALLQGVIACNEEEILAGQLGIETEWMLMKDQFMKALQEQYGLDGETVEIICALRNPNYTVAVENIMAGKVYNDMSAYGGEAPADVNEGVTEGAEENASAEVNSEPEDMLPGEEELLEQLQQEAVQENEESSETTGSGDKELYSGTVEGGSVNFVE